MAVTRQKKEEIVKKIKESLSRAKSLIFINYFGLTVKDANDLRKELGKNNCQLLVAKKTLFDKALKDSEKKIELETKNLKGGLGIIFGFEDEIIPAKIIVNFIKEKNKGEINGGIFNGEFIDKEKIEELAKLPSREELLRQLLWMIKSPITGFVSVQRNLLKGLISVLDNIKKQK